MQPFFLQTPAGRVAILITVMTMLGELAVSTAGLMNQNALAPGGEGAAIAPVATRGGDLPNPLFPTGNWWNLDVSQAPVDPQSSAFIGFINNGGSRRLHPDFGGHAWPGSTLIYGFPYVVVSGDQPKRPVTFFYADESDGVDPQTGQPTPFYPIPDEAIIEPYWIEGGDPGHVDLRGSQDRHMLIVDRDNQHLYELYNVYFDGAQWRAGSGAFFDLRRNDRRPEGWTSADAAGLAILPGLVRYDEVFGPGEIHHAFRVTVRATNGYVYPASHRAGSNPQALPMGARLRLKPTTDLSPFTPEAQKIFRAMQRYGLLVADNGSDMFVSGAFDPRWNNDILNPAFRALTANDFEVIELGWRGAAVPEPPAPCQSPGAPQGLHHWNDGLLATLVWGPPLTGLPVATYLIEVGSVAGASDLLVTGLGPATTLTATAPPGRYFVRLRGQNGCGIGPSSNEIVVTLP